MKRRKVEHMFKFRNVNLVQCPICGFVFRRGARVRNQYVTFVCPHCRARFYIWDARLLHFDMSKRTLIDITPYLQDWLEKLKQKHEEKRARREAVLV